MTFSQGIKRLGMPLAAFMGLIGIAMIAMALLTDRDALRTAVEAQIRAATGLELVVNGPVEVSLFPGNFVRMRQVGLKGGGALSPALTIDELTANLKLLPLVLRRYEIADLRLVRPHVSVTRDAQGKSNWTPIAETLARTMKPGIDSPVSFSEIRVIDGDLAFKDDQRPQPEVLSDIDIALAWPSISRSFAATGQFTWRGERVDGSLSVSDFIAVLSGERSGLKVRVAAPPLKIAFDGAVADKASLLLEGTLNADSPSMRNALRWMGHELPGTAGFGRFALKARANAVGGSTALTNLNIELDGNVAEGVLTYGGDGRRALQATLATETLDLSPYAETIRLAASGQRDWNRQPFDVSGLSSADVDMRLSAARVTMGNVKVGRTALGVGLRSGSLALSIGEAQIYGGILKGSFGISRPEAASSVKAQFQFTDVDLEALATEMFGVRKLSGRGNLGVVLEATGDSPFALAQSLDGTVALTGRDGAISGLNVEQLLRRLERRPLAGGGDFRNGRTPFSTLNVAAKLIDGVATLEDVRIDGPTARLSLSGTATVPTREYDLKGIASLVAAPTAAPGFALPFVIQGPWDDPLIFPDPESLIRRSPASAPLLDAVRDRSARDAVRAVIDRFKGGAKPAAPADAPAAEAGN